MKERPILFSGEMVRAILDGRKSQTRRVVKGLPATLNKKLPLTLSLCPYGVPGDRLWVREPWKTSERVDDLSGKEIGEKVVRLGYLQAWAPLLYLGDNERRSWPKDEWGEPGRYRHARFMPRWASRITLEITNVRVERLQDISEEDAVAEGVEGARLPGDDREGGYLCKADFLFAHLWARINKKPGTTWGENPWVWVIEFKRL